MAKFRSSCTIVCGISMVIHHQLKICVVPSPWAWQKLGTCWFTFFNHIIVSTHNKLTVNYKHFQAAIYKSSIHTQTTYPAMLTLNSESMWTNLKYYGRERDRHMQWAGNDHCSLWYAVSACTMSSVCSNLSSTALYSVPLYYPDDAHKFRTKSKWRLLDYKKCCSNLWRKI
jgi:hypothetical protein